MKNTLETSSSRRTEAEEQITDLEERVVKIIATEQNKETKEMRTVSEPSGDNIKCTNI